VSSAVPKLCGRSSKGNAAQPSPTRSMLPMRRGVHGAIGLPTTESRAARIAPAPGDRRQCRRPWRTTSMAALTTPRSSTVPAMPSGVVRHSPPSAPARPASNSAARASAPWEKNALSSSRPTGRLAPDPAELAWASLARAALEYRARRGELIVLSEDATVLWRLALARAGWWRTAPRARLPSRPLSPSQSTREESRKRQAWGPYRAWSRSTSGVWRSVLGAVPYGPSQVVSKLVPHCETEGLRH
jgi:hypothetical protein